MYWSSSELQAFLKLNIGGLYWSFWLDTFKSWLSSELWSLLQHLDLKSKQFTHVHFLGEFLQYISIVISAILRCESVFLSLVFRMFERDFSVWLWGSRTYLLFLCAVACWTSHRRIRLNILKLVSMDFYSLPSEFTVIQNQKSLLSILETSLTEPFHDSLDSLYAHSAYLTCH